MILHNWPDVASIVTLNYDINPATALQMAQKLAWGNMLLSILYMFPKKKDNDVSLYFVNLLATLHCGV